MTLGVILVCLVISTFVELLHLPGNQRLLNFNTRFTI